MEKGDLADGLCPGRDLPGFGIANQNYCENFRGVVASFFAKLRMGHVSDSLE
jgi:hypothetical protein